MADHCPVLELLAQLTATPVRRGGILDIPFDEYVEAVAWPEVGKLLGAYVHTQRRPTLRSVLIDPRQPPPSYGFMNIGQPMRSPMRRTSKSFA